MSLWKGLPNGFAHLLICHIGDSLRITLDGLYDGEFARYTVIREFRDYAHTWDELLMRARADPDSLWRQALEDIAKEYDKNKRLENVLRLIQALISSLP